MDKSFLLHYRKIEFDTLDCKAQYLKVLLALKTFGIDKEGFFNISCDFWDGKMNFLSAGIVLSNYDEVQSIIYGKDYTKMFQIYNDNCSKDCHDMIDTVKKNKRVITSIIKRELKMRYDKKMTQKEIGQILISELERIKKIYPLNC